MIDRITLFITWTTYGTWLPGDSRGWRKTGFGNLLPEPHLAEWCRTRLSEEPVLLTSEQRQKIDRVCRDHACIRDWPLHAITVRTNHVHLVVTADRKPSAVRDQFKANATRILREGPNAISQTRIWTKGGDCEVINGDENLERVVQYVNEAQDRKGRDALQ